jgi:hypothetical protein
MGALISLYRQLKNIEWYKDNVFKKSDSVEVRKPLAFKYNAKHRKSKSCLAGLYWQI